MPANILYIEKVKGRSAPQSLKNLKKVKVASHLYTQSQLRTPPVLISSGTVEDNRESFGVVLLDIGGSLRGTLDPGMSPFISS